MADRGPFGNAFNPSNGGLTGFLGSLAGVPSDSQQSGDATGAALQELSALKESGLNNQQAMLKFFQSPAGHEFFSTAGPNGLQTLANGLSTLTPPAPTMNNIAPGGMLTATDPATGQTRTAASNPQQFPNQVIGPQDMQVNGKGDVLAVNPNQKASEVPADVRSFQFFTQLAGLPPEEVKKLAAIKADPTQADKSTAATQAIDELQKNYNLDPQLALALKAGQVKLQPLKNGQGQDTGAFAVVDLTNPNSGVRIVNPGNNPVPGVPAASTTTSVPGTTPATGAATGTLPAAEGPPPPSNYGKASSIPTNNPTYFGNKASMFLASGPIATGLQGASAASEMINPKLIIPEGAQAADRQTMIDTLRSDLAAMGTMGEGLSANKGVINGYLKLAPTGGLTESPHQAIQKAIRLSEHLQNEIDAETETFNNPNLPQEARKGAQARIQGWQRVQRDMPSNDELINMEKAIREGTAGAPTISGAVDTVVKAGSKALSEVNKEVGTVKKQQGLDTIDWSNASPQQLQATDPNTLSGGDAVKYKQRVQALIAARRKK